MQILSAGRKEKNIPWKSFKHLLCDERRSRRKLLCKMNGPKMSRGRKKVNKIDFYCDDFVVFHGKFVSIFRENSQEFGTRVAVRSN